MAAALLALLLFPLSALAQEARDMTKDCAITVSGNAKKAPALTDGQYDTFWRCDAARKGYIELTAPEGEALFGVYVKWYLTAPSWRMTVQNGNKWETVAGSDSGYLAEYLTLPEGAARVRVQTGETSKDKLSVAELRVFGAGAPPEDVQIWSPSYEKCDILALVAHPDDELLFLGGLIPLYAGEKGKKVQACYVVPTSARRKLELLDGLWHCGARAYPIFGPMRDNFAMSLSGMYEKWSKTKLYSFVTRAIRMCKPDVIVTHDRSGEYGHGAHRATADAAIRCFEYAANPNKYTKSTKEYGAWRASKLYLHLYKKNALTMDWRVPLAAFDGKTAFDVTCEAFQMHVSQRNTEYTVLDSGAYDNRLFGLYASLVGQDTDKSDFLENIGETLVTVTVGK